MYVCRWRTFKKSNLIVIRLTEIICSYKQRQREGGETTDLQCGGLDNFNSRMDNCFIAFYRSSDSRMRHSKVRKVTKSILPLCTDLRWKIFACNLDIQAAKQKYGDTILIFLLVENVVWLVSGELPVSAKCATLDWKKTTNNLIFVYCNLLVAVFLQRTHLWIFRIPIGTHSGFRHSWNCNPSLIGVCSKEESTTWVDIILRNKQLKLKIPVTDILDFG